MVYSASKEVGIASFLPGLFFFNTSRNPFCPCVTSYLQQGVRNVVEIWRNPGSLELFQKRKEVKAFIAEVKVLSVHGEVGVTCLNQYCCLRKQVRSLR